MIRYINKYDFIIILGLIFIMMLVVFGNSDDATDNIVIIQSLHGTRVIPFTHKKDFNLVLEGPTGKSIVHFGTDGVCMSSSSCKNQICVKTGIISKVNESIVCLPNRIFIVISTKEHQTKFEKVDALL